jgi:O-antigen/teichoic acid export membrane protein
MINLVGAFVARTVLIHILGVEFAGLDGLFSSVLTMLNMAELGFGSAVVYKLYKPIAEGNDETVCALINYYKIVYRIIGTIVLIVGIAVIPFLSYIVNSELPDTINIYILYLIYLANTVLSYWLFAYKTALLNAHQRTDLVSKISSVAFLIKYMLQFLLLILVKNYYVYVIVIPVTTLLTNIGNAYMASKYYPQYFCKGKIDTSEKKEIREKVTALLYNKIGVAIINGSDNLVISSFLGLKMLGIYSSYYYIFSMLHSFFDVFHNAITAGIGNSIVTEDVDTNYKLFGHLNFINTWVVGWCSICLCCLYQPFMWIWVGKANTLTNYFSIIMSCYFYFWMVRFVTLIFKNAQGLWRQDRFRPLMEGILNLILNLVMVRQIGIYGITISTIIAMLAVSLPWETNVLFKYYFKRTPVYYYLEIVSRFLIMTFIGALTYFLCSLVNVGTVATFVFRGIICMFVPNIMLIVIYKKSENIDYALHLAKNIIRKR